MAGEECSSACPQEDINRAETHGGPWRPSVKMTTGVEMRRITHPLRDIAG
jgi:hypothetical protein